MKILFFHASDLFERTGTATIYRRVLPFLPSGIVLHHVGVFWQSTPDLSEMREAYRRTLPRIRLELPAFQGVMQSYIAVCTRVFGRVRYRPLVAFYGWWLRRRLRRIQPDMVWFSSDYLGLSHWFLDELLPHLGNRHLHLSIYDPLEIWSTDPQILKRYQRVLARTNSFDVIGERMRMRLAQEAPGKPVTILSDYLDKIPPPSFNKKIDREIIGVVAGRIYDKRELQQLVDTLGSIGSSVCLRWYGNERDSHTASEINWPASVRLERMGLVPRDEIVTRISGADFAYLSFPATPAEFALYSLPTKLVTYAEAGLPVLFHAPAASEMQDLNERHGFGINLSVIEEVETAVRHFLKEPDSFQAGIRSLASERFACEKVRASLSEIINQTCVIPSGAASSLVCNSN